MLPLSQTSSPNILTNAHIIKQWLWRAQVLKKPGVTDDTGERQVVMGALFWPQHDRPGHRPTSGHICLVSWDSSRDCLHQNFSFSGENGPANERNQNVFLRRKVISEQLLRQVSWFCLMKISMSLSNCSPHSWKYH